MKDNLNEPNRHRLVGLRCGFVLGVSAAAKLLEGEGYPAMARRLFEALGSGEITPASSPLVDSAVDDLVIT